MPTLPPPSAVLIVRQGDEPGRVHPLVFGANVIGRGEGADVRVRSSEVSRRHVRVDLRDDGIFVVDLGSKNGVYVDGQRVPAGETGIALRDGGRVELGDVVLELDDAAGRVGQALVDGGEVTVTRRRTGALEPERAASRPGLVAPLLAAFLFAVAAYVLWTLGV